MNLVMIGRFEDAADATKTVGIIEKLRAQVSAEAEAREEDRFSDEMLKLLTELELHTFAPSDLEQFAYDVTVEAVGQEVIVRTDEVDVLAFLKVLLDRGARIEVYSAHQHPGTGYGRGESRPQKGT